MKVLGIDPGFSSMGWAIADVDAGVVRVELIGVFRTEKDTKRTNTRSSEDNIRRAGMLYDCLCATIKCNNVKVIATETMSWPRNAGVVAKMGVAWGVIAAASRQYGVPITQASPMVLKRAVTGNGKASKEEMIAAIRTRYPDLKWPNQETLQEHAADAAGSIIACMDSELMRFANGF
jgi:crossover junction endodeoxyribonuclease RuvC